MLPLSAVKKVCVSLQKVNCHHLVCGRHNNETRIESGDMCLLCTDATLGSSNVSEITKNRGTWHLAGSSLMLPLFIISTRNLVTDIVKLYRI